MLNQQRGTGNQTMEAEGQQEEEMKLLDFNLTKIGTIFKNQMIKAWTGGGN